MTPTGETFILLPEGLELAWSTVSPNERQISHSVLCGDERQVISILPPEIVGLSKIQQRPSSVNRPFGRLRSTAAIQMTAQPGGSGAAIGSLLSVPFAIPQTEIASKLPLLVVEPLSGNIDKYKASKTCGNVTHVMQKRAA